MLTSASVSEECLFFGGDNFTYIPVSYRTMAAFLFLCMLHSCIQDFPFSPSPNIVTDIKLSPNGVHITNLQICHATKPATTKSCQNTSVRMPQISDQQYMQSINTVNMHPHLHLRNHLKPSHPYPPTAQPSTWFGGVTLLLCNAGRWHILPRSSMDGTQRRKALVLIRF
jgi:hypothetical protein